MRSGDFDCFVVSFVDSMRSYMSMAGGEEKYYGSRSRDDVGRFLY